MPDFKRFLSKYAAADAVCQAVIVEAGDFAWQTVDVAGYAASDFPEAVRSWADRDGRLPLFVLAQHALGDPVTPNKDGR